MSELYDVVTIAVTNKEFFNFAIKAPIVFIHFIAAAYAIITILSLDMHIAMNYRDPITQPLLNQIRLTESRVNKSLIILYITGIFFVVFGMINIENYMDNQKLLFKMIVVGILTVNGILVSLISHNLKVGQRFIDMGFLKGSLVKIVGTVSSVSWLTACYLGVARDWNFKIDLMHLSQMYIMSLILGFIMVNTLLFFRNFRLYL